MNNPLLKKPGPYVEQSLRKKFAIETVCSLAQPIRAQLLELEMLLRK
jgi:hypothetical protein